MLAKRIFSSIVLAICTILITLFASDVVFGLTVSVLIFFTLLEFYKLVEENNIYTFKYFSSFLALLFPLILTFRNLIFTAWPLLFFISILLFLFLLEFTKKDSYNAVNDIAISLLGIIYICVPLSFFILIRYLDNGNAYIILLILITKASDIGAYWMGNKFGNVRLIPRISPKKSIEGAFGGISFSVVISLLASIFFDISIVYFLIIGIVISALAQVGDLSESLLKRCFKVKDSGTFIPGFGGILDLLDSLLFTLPFFYFYLILIS